MALEGGWRRAGAPNNLSRAGGGEAAGQMSGGVVEVSDEVFAAAERGDGAVILAWLTGRCCARSNMQGVKQVQHRHPTSAQEKGLLIPPSHLRDRQMGMHVVNESCVCLCPGDPLGVLEFVRDRERRGDKFNSTAAEICPKLLDDSTRQGSNFFGVW